MSMTRFVFAATATLLIPLLVSCQSSSPADTQASVASHDAVVVNYPNGGGTVVFVRGANPDEPLCLCSPGTQVSQECRDGAVKYFQTGVLNPHCPLTGATWTVVNYPSPSVD